MGRLTRTVTRAGYRHVVKPLLFRRHPDAVHADIVRLGKLVPHMLGVRSIPRSWAYHNSKYLRQTLMGVSFRNPVGLAAGFDKNIELAPLMKSIGFGFMTGGSVTAVACDGNPRPWFHRLPRSKSLVVHAGLPNVGVKRIVETIASYPRRLCADFPLVLSVAKTNAEFTAVDDVAIDDYCASLTQLELSSHIALYELNISCPNAYGGEPFTDAGRLDELLHRIDQLKLTRPMVVKMPISLSWVHTSALLDVIARHDVAGVTIGNLLKDRHQAQLDDELDDDTKGSLSGLPTRDISTELIRKTYQHYGERLIIIGVGGIFSAEDAYAKIRAGASLVELITGMIFEGPQLIGEITHGLIELLEHDGFTHISQAVGVDSVRPTTNHSTTASARQEAA
ncbi:MAG: quinone-dependent dihydroorotate dehydrogenase [Candidatus Saccharimonadales bacterium]